MPRETVSETVLLKALIDETGKQLGTDANHIVDKIKIAYRRGEPNWDAEIAFVGLATHRAFSAALQKIKKHYNYVR